jgi:hypothetical protein
MANSFGRWPKSGSLAILMASAWLAGGNARLRAAQESLPTPKGPVKVEIRTENGGFRLYRGGALAIRWEIMPEVARGGYAGMGEKRSQPMPGLVRKTDEREIVSVEGKHGKRRAFVLNGAVLSCRPDSRGIER